MRLEGAEAGPCTWRGAQACDRRGGRGRDVDECAPERLTEIGAFGLDKLLKTV